MSTTMIYTHVMMKPGIVCETHRCVGWRPANVSVIHLRGASIARRCLAGVRFPRYRSLTLHIVRVCNWLAV